MPELVGYNHEAREAAERARNAPGTVRVDPAGIRKRQRVVYDRQTGEHKVITEKAGDPVPDALTAYRSHAIFAPSVAAEVPERHGLNEEQTARFWRAVREGRR